MRLFVAAYPPPSAGEHLAAFVADLAVGRAAATGVNARLAVPATWHVTVAFLGDVPDERLGDVEAALGKAVAGWRQRRDAERDGAPRLRLAGGGRFGRGRFTVLWVGMGGDVPALAELGKGTRKALKRAKLPYDDRPFKPHLTIARPGDRVTVTGDIAALKGYSGPEWTLDEVRLMRSHLGPKPTYDELATWPLNA